jgi:hypothetical protein
MQIPPASEPWARLVGPAVAPEPITRQRIIVSAEGDLPMSGKVRQRAGRPRNGHRRAYYHGVCGRLAALLVLGGVLAAGCASSRPVPTQKYYVDRHNRAFELAVRAIEEIGGEVVAENRWAGMVTGMFAEEVAVHVIHIEVRVERHDDESWVSAVTRTDATAVTDEDLDLWRARFFEALDALMGVEPRGRGESGLPPEGPPLKILH